MPSWPYARLMGADDWTKSGVASFVKAIESDNNVGDMIWSLFGPSTRSLVPR